jgi:hypothetical protein
VYREGGNAAESSLDGGGGGQAGACGGLKGLKERVGSLTNPKQRRRGRITHMRARARVHVRARVVLMRSRGGVGIAWWSVCGVLTGFCNIVFACVKADSVCACVRPKNRKKTECSAVLRARVL